MIVEPNSDSVKTPLWFLCHMNEVYGMNHDGSSVVTSSDFLLR